jgi:Spy/CpxP family protein refolding chaperone
MRGPMTSSRGLDQMNKFRIAALGAALVIGVSVQAQAQTGADAGRRGGQRGAAMRDLTQSPLFRGIELTDAQKVQVRTIGEKYTAQRQELRRAAGGGNADGQRQRPDSATMAKTRELMSKQQDEVRAVLTADQQKTFDRNVAESRNRQPGQRPNGQGRGGRVRNG